MIYEPWSPQPRQRVQIRRSAECPLNEEYLHAPQYPDGSLGDVLTRLSDIRPGGQSDDGHDYFVIMGTDTEDRMYGGWFAACELDPVSE